MTQQNVANSMLISLSSSGQIAPNQWLNPVNGVSYSVAVQTPQTVWTRSMRSAGLRSIRATAVTATAIAR
jgi:hypothetical protein